MLRASFKYNHPAPFFGWKSLYVKNRGKSRESAYWVFLRRIYLPLNDGLEQKNELKHKTQNGWARCRLDTRIFRLEHIYSGSEVGIESQETHLETSDSKNRAVTGRIAGSKQRDGKKKDQLGFFSSAQGGLFSYNQLCRNPRIKYAANQSSCICFHPPPSDFSSPSLSRENSRLSFPALVILGKFWSQLPPRLRRKSRPSLAPKPWSRKTRGNEASSEIYVGVFDPSF